MAMVTIRPTYDALKPAAWVLSIGMSTLWQCLNDGGAYPGGGNDGTYAQNPYDFQWFRVGFSPTAFTPPVTPYRIVYVRIRVRGWTAAAFTTQSLRCSMVSNNIQDTAEDDFVLGGPGVGYAAGFSGIHRRTRPNGSPWTAKWVNQLQVAVRGNNAADNTISEMWVDISYADAPVINVITPTGVITTSRPVVVSSYSAEAGRPQSYYQVKVFTQAQYSSGSFSPDRTTPIYDSGARPGTSTTMTLGGGQVQKGVVLSSGGIFRSDLPPGTLRAYVRSATDVNAAPLWSLWDFTEFTVTVEQPATPQVAAAPDPTAGLVALTINGFDNWLSKQSADADLADAATPTGWWQPAASTTVARSTAQSFQGAAAWRLTNTGAAGSDRALTLGTYVLGQVAPGHRYSGSARVKAVSTTANVRVDLIWWSDTFPVGTSVGTVVSATSGGWANPTITAIAPPGAKWVQIQVLVIASPAAAYDIDAISIRPGSDPTYTRGGAANRNLLTANASTGAGTDISDYAVINDCTLARSTAQAASGTSSLAMTSTSGATDMRASTVTGTDGIPVVPGKKYSALASFRAASAIAYVQCNIAWYNSDGDQVGLGLGAPGVDSNSGWTQVACLDVVAPPDAATAAVVCWTTASGSGVVHYVDQISLSRSNATLWVPGEAHETIVQVRYTDDGGETFNYVRGAGATSFEATQSLLVDDHEASPGDARSYYATVILDPEGASAQSGDSAPALASVDSPVWWLKDPLNPELSIARNEGFLVNVTTDSVDERVGIYEVLGDGLPVVLSDAVTGTDGTLRITSIGGEEFRKLRALLKAPRTLLLVDPLEREQRYIRFVGPRRWTKRRTGAGVMRELDASFREVARP